MIIYKITNTINNKIYIGQTKRSLEERWKAHLHAAKQKRDIYLYKAINYYGPHCFHREEIDKAVSIEELNEKEIKHIALYNSTNPNIGYNGTFGGYSGYPTEAVKKQISDKAKMRALADPGRIVGKANPNYGKTHTPETLAKMSRARAGIRVTKKKCSSKFVGVCQRAGSDKWTSIVKLANGPQVFLGYFSTEDLAAQAYSDAVKTPMLVVRRRGGPTRIIIKPPQPLGKELTQ